MLTGLTSTPADGERDFGEPSELLGSRAIFAKVRKNVEIHHNQSLFDGG